MRHILTFLFASCVFKLCFQIGLKKVCLSLERFFYIFENFLTPDSVTVLIFL